MLYDLHHINIFVYKQGVFKTKSFHELSSEALCYTLQSDKLTLDEWYIVEAVREWATVNSVSIQN